MKIPTNFNSSAPVSYPHHSKLPFWVIAGFVGEALGHEISPQGGKKVEKWGLEDSVTFIYFLKSVCVHACVHVCSYTSMCVFRHACLFVHMKEPDLEV